VYARLDLVFGSEEGILFSSDKCVTKSWEQIKDYFIGILFIMHINYIGFKLSFVCLLVYIYNFDNESYIYMINIVLRGE